jgi:hypothetical protein
MKKWTVKGDPRTGGSRPEAGIVIERTVRR